MLREEYTPQKFLLYDPISSGKCKRMYSDRSVVAWGRVWVSGQLRERLQRNIRKPWV